MSRAKKKEPLIDPPMMRQPLYTYKWYQAFPMTENALSGYSRIITEGLERINQELSDYEESLKENE